MILLVRHTAVALAWRRRCYGRSDIGLSRAGAAEARRLMRELAAWRPDHIVHSGLRRAGILAEGIGEAAGVANIIDPGWAERDFGSWEGRRWSAIYRETGDAMNGMIDSPESFRPGGGETTSELAERAKTAAAALPAGRTIVVTHGGPIAALRGTAAGLPPREWLALVPQSGQAVAFDVNTLCRRP
jgi:broad specificity phosphatase PhoE